MTGFALPRGAWERDEMKVNG